MNKLTFIIANKSDYDHYYFEYLNLENTKYLLYPENYKYPLEIVNICKKFVQDYYNNFNIIIVTTSPYIASVINNMFMVYDAKLPNNIFKGYIGINFENAYGYYGANKICIKNSEYKMFDLENNLNKTSEKIQQIFKELLYK